MRNEFAGKKNKSRASAHRTLSTPFRCRDKRTIIIMMVNKDIIKKIW